MERVLLGFIFCKKIEKCRPRGRLFGHSSVVFAGVCARCVDYVALFITAPSHMEALTGSCLQIPCRFELKDPDKFNSSGDIYGVWIKGVSQTGSNLGNVVFNSSGTITTYPMNITGSLKEKNCTTLFSNLTTTHTDKYFFRVQNWPFRATAACDDLHVKVKGNVYIFFSVSQRKG